MLLYKIQLVPWEEERERQEGREFDFGEGESRIRKNKGMLSGSIEKVGKVAFWPCPSEVHFSLL